MQDSRSDLIAYQRLSYLTDLQTSLENSLKESTDPNHRDQLIAAIKECDKEFSQILGTTQEEYDFNLSRIIKSVQDANRFIEEAEIREYRSAAGADQLQKGLGCAFIAGIVSLVSYITAGPGETYYLFWGALAWGGYMILRGTINLVLSRTR